MSNFSNSHMHSQLQVGNEGKHLSNGAITNQISCKGLLDNSILGEVRG